jgi:hypothetical protein
MIHNYGGCRFIQNGHPMLLVTYLSTYLLVHLFLLYFSSLFLQLG